jgi:sugar phosphate isomerase/epimerase
MSLRLSIENYVPRLFFGDKKAIDLIADAGFDAMDFSFYWMKEDDNFLAQDDYLAHARQVRAWADDRGLAISQAHAPFDFKLADEPEKQAHDREMIRRSIECAGIMGAEQIIIHNIPTPDPADFFETNLAFFKSFEETALKSHVKIGVENLVAREENRPMPGRLGTPEELNAFMDQLDPEVFCVCIDLGHAQLVTKDPAAFIRGIGLPRLQSLHVQDTIYHLDSHNLPYLGRQNWDDIISALREVNYAGDFTLEVFLFLKAFPKEALVDALQLAHTVGRGLIARIEAN